MTSPRYRIAVDGRALTEPAGGLRRYADEVLPLLPTIGTDVDWQLVLQEPIAAPHERYSMTVLPGSLNALLRPLWEDLRLPRVVHAGLADALFSPYGIVPNIDVPVVAMVHDLQVLRLPSTLPWRHRRYWRRVARRLPRAARVITNSAATADDVAALTSVSADRITIAHLASSAVFCVADPRRVDRVLRDLGLRQPYVLMVGVGTPRKDAAAVARAVTDLGDVALVTVGRIAVCDSAHHLGVLDDETLAIVMSGAFAVACPSRLEGFGLPVVEAMACGTPVVASRTPAVEEVAGDAAILISEENESAWRRAFEDLKDRPHLRRRQSEAGLARSAQLSWHTTASAVVRSIRAAVSDEC